MFLTVKETAEILRISERHTYRLIKDDVIPHVRLGGKILVKKEELMKKLESESV